LGEAFHWKATMLSGKPAYVFKMERGQVFRVFSVMKT